VTRIGDRDPRSIEAEEGMAIEAQGTLGVVVVGPAGRGRSDLARRLTRLGHAVTAVDAAVEADLAGADVVLLRSGGAETQAVDVPESHPVLIVAEEGHRMFGGLEGRPGGLVILTGAETDGGYQVALRLCALMRPRPAAEPR
jgi:hypothetical protein